LGRHSVHPQALHALKGALVFRVVPQQRLIDDGDANPAAIDLPRMQRPKAKAWVLAER
jgi:hypothetical protein